MKMIKRIGGLVVVFLLTIYNTCLADVVVDPENHRQSHARHVEPSDLEPATNPLKYALIGYLVLVVIVCAVIIIRRMIKKKNENKNDSNNK